MTIEFMVIAGERSGSTWAANWLTTDTTLCIHDPLHRCALEDLDGIAIRGKRIGIACTALQLAPHWLNAHPAKKIILRRHDEDIRSSWARIGIQEVPSTPGTADRLGRIDGWHYRYEDLFDQAHARTMSTLLGVPFDAHRHAELVQMNIQPHWAAVQVTKRGAEQLVDRIRKTLE